MMLNSMSIIYEKLRIQTIKIDDEHNSGQCDSQEFKQ